MFYLILAIIIFIFGIYKILIKNENRINGVELYIVFLLFWLIAGLSYQTGVDWYVYEDVYKSALTPLSAIDNRGFYSEDSGVQVEPAFGLISSFAKLITEEFQLTQIILLLIAAVALIISLKKYTKNYYAVLLLYLGYIYLTLNMSGIRQSVSLSLFMFSIQYIFDRKLTHFIFIIFIASLFHYTAIFLLPLYVFIDKKISNKLSITIILLGLILYFLRLNIFGLIPGSIDNILVHKFNQYLLLSDVNNKISLKVLLYIILFWIFTKDAAKLQAGNKYTNILNNLFLIYIILTLYFWNTGDIGIRMQHYFVIGLIFLLPEYIGLYKKIFKKIIVLTFIFVLAIWSSSPIFLDWEGGGVYNPYQNYIVMKIFDIQSTGEERRNDWINR